MEKLFSIDWESNMKFWQAVFEKSVLTIFVLLWPLAIQFGTKLVSTPHVAISAKKSQSGQQNGGLMPFYRQFNLLLWCKVILNSDEQITKILLENTDVIYRVSDKNVKTLVKVFYSFIEESRNSGRHDGGLESMK